VGFSSRKATSKKNDATRQPPLSAWLHLAHHAPLPSEKISTKVCARSTALFALGVRGEETL